MSKPEFVYVTYIETTADKLWHALTDSEFTERYWFGYRVTSDWKVGSSYHFAKNGIRSVQGEVLIADPPKRLAYSWDVVKEGVEREQVSRVTFDIEPRGRVVKLTVTHDNLGSKTLRDVSGGWPMVMASLKSFLETGRELPPDLPACGTKEATNAQA
ncbi:MULTISPECIES: SRPBCC family protein [unclassified Bradyrhizobium]|uniref:SRPBCC family protein n=1 Tax=unclassified Bradyrhizobium TaxID=2631580 RepID=UPI0024784276|nr:MULTISPECIES: SRPBCC family protein [unclassified Bradyrhizobium]WGS21985.1 SRPBCC family protein [Bradyrhizobium sp. ISRA463]WGS28944.1 SRPBCC family protein [Bradyrhizobium sp. ISRA464]